MVAYRRGAQPTRIAGRSGCVALAEYRLGRSRADLGRQRPQYPRVPGTRAARSAAPGRPFGVLRRLPPVAAARRSTSCCARASTPRISPSSSPACGKAPIWPTSSASSEPFSDRAAGEPADGRPLRHRLPSTSTRRRRGAQAARLRSGRGRSTAPGPDRPGIGEIVAARISCSTSAASCGSPRRPGRRSTTWRRPSSRRSRNA